MDAKFELKLEIEKILALEYNIVMSIFLRTSRLTLP